MASSTSGRPTLLDLLPTEVLADIHGRLLLFVDRLALAVACHANTRHLLKPEPPCLVLPSPARDKAKIFSPSDNWYATSCAPDPAMRGHLVVGSSGGWLVTADALGALRVANPITSEQADLPVITTIPFLRQNSPHHDEYLSLDVDQFVKARFGHRPPRGHKIWDDVPPGTYIMTSGDMRRKFYRKVVLSSSPCPHK